MFGLETIVEQNKKKQAPIFGEGIINKKAIKALSPKDLRRVAKILENVKK